MREMDKIVQKIRANLQIPSNVWSSVDGILEGEVDIAIVSQGKESHGYRRSQTLSRRVGFRSDSELQRFGPGAERAHRRVGISGEGRRASQVQSGDAGRRARVSDPPRSGISRYPGGTPGAGGPW